MILFGIPKRTCTIVYKYQLIGSIENCIEFYIVCIFNFKKQQQKKSRILLSEVKFNLNIINRFFLVQKICVVAII